MERKDFASYEQRIREARPRMSKSFTRLADYLLDSYVQAALMTATELAHQVDVDAATVVRFAQTLGYSGFPDMQREIRERVKRDLLIRPKEAAEPDSVPGVVDATMQRLSGAVEQARKLLDADAVEAFVEKVGAARRINIMPTGLARAAANNLVNLLEQGGFLVTVAQNTVTDLARAVSTATPEDLLVGVDVAGETPYIARALAEAKALGIPTAAIAGAASLEVAQAADIVVAAQSQPEVGLGIVVMDAVVYTLAEALRWRYPKQFKGSDKALEAMFDRIQVGDK